MDQRTILRMLNYPFGNRVSFEEATCTGEAGETSDGSVRGCAIKCKSCLGHICSVRDNIRVHQGSAQIPLLFNLVMEEATKECRRGVPWDVLHADDLVLTAET